MISSGSEMLGDSPWYMYCTASQSAAQADLQQEMNNRASLCRQASDSPFARAQTRAPAVQYVNVRNPSWKLL
jgi:hypothetical protein